MQLKTTNYRIIGDFNTGRSNNLRMIVDAFCYDLDLLESDNHASRLYLTITGYLVNISILYLVVYLSFYRKKTIKAV